MATSACRERPVRSTLSFNTFRENITTSRQTSSEGHSVHCGRSVFWVYAEKLSCEILNSLQLTHKKLNMGLYGKKLALRYSFWRNWVSGKQIFPYRPMKFFKKSVALAGYKNKQTVSRRRYLARVLSSLMYRYALRQSASVSRFLYPAKGYGIRYNFLH